VPARGPGGAPAGQRRRRRGAPPLPGLHLGRPHALHAAPLPRRHPHAGRLHTLALPRPGPGGGGGSLQHLAAGARTEPKEGSLSPGPGARAGVFSPRARPGGAGPAPPSHFWTLPRARVPDACADGLLLLLLVYIYKHIYIHIIYISKRFFSLLCLHSSIACC
jgi:hypothetical protein